MKQFLSRHADTLAVAGLALSALLSTTLAVTEHPAGCCAALAAFLLFLVLNAVIDLLTP